MGTYNSIHVGIYLEVPYVKGTETDTFYAHPETGKRQKSKFDAQTGRENVKNSVQKTVYVTPMSYIVEDGYIEDQFSTPPYTNAGKHIQTFLLNDKKYCNNFDNLNNLNLTDLDIPNLITEFKIEYRKYLDYYTNLYGVVNIKYGVVYYAS